MTPVRPLPVMDREMRDRFLATVLGVFILLSFSAVCRAQRAAPGEWIHRTLANAAANEATQRAKEIPPGRWWHLPFFAGRLNISGQEKAQLDKLFDYNRNRLVQLKVQIEQERIRLVDSMDREHLDERAAMSQDETAGEQPDPARGDSVYLFVAGQKIARVRSLRAVENAFPKLARAAGVPG